MKIKINIALAIALYLSALSGAMAQTRDFVQTDVVRVSGVTTDDALFALGVAGRQTSRVYIDGLGRTAQSMALKGSPGQRDMIQPVVYDSVGRNSYSYLPYTSRTGGGGYRAELQHHLLREKEHQCHQRLVHQRRVSDR